MTAEGWWVAGLALLAVVLLLAMRAGWRRRTTESAALVPDVPTVPAPADVPATTGAPAADVEATYVSTTLGGDWLARVTAHDLGVRSPARVEVRADGVALRRTGARDVFVPREALDGVGTAPGMAGKFVGGEGLVVLHWHLGGVRLDTGLRTRRRADRAVLTEAVGTLLTAARPGGPATQQTTEEDQR